MKLPAAKAPPPLPAADADAIRKEPTKAVAPPPPPTKKTVWKFKARRYKADKWLPVGGVAMFLGALLAAAIVLGIGASILSHYFWVVMMFSALIGAALGGIAGFGLKIAKVNSPVFCYFALACAAAASILTSHVADYLSERRADPRTAQMGFFQFTGFKADQGLQLVSKSGTRQNNTELRGWQVYLYWIAEAAVMLAIAIVVMHQFASAPFCIGCKSWKTQEPLGKIYLWDEDLSFGKLKFEAAARLEAGDLAWLRDHADGQRDVFLVGVYKCPHCDDAPIEAELIYFNPAKQKNNDKTKISLATYPAKAEPSLRQLMDDVARQ